MATAVELKLENLRKILAAYESGLVKAEKRLDELLRDGFGAGDFRRQDKKVLSLREEVKKQKKRIGKYETTVQKKEREAANK